MKRLARHSMLMLAVLVCACQEPERQNVAKKSEVIKDGKTEVIKDDKTGAFKDGRTDSLSREQRIEADAKRAIASGHLSLRSGPEQHHPLWHPEFRKLLEERHGVQYWVSTEPAGGGGGAWERYAAKGRADADAWNSVMTVEIRKKFGDNVLEDLQAEAKKSHDAKSQARTKEYALGMGNGRANAIKAIAAGRLVWKNYTKGTPASNYTYMDFVKLLREKCGVDYESDNAVKHSTELFAYAKGWNEAVSEELERRFGPGILASLRSEARKRYDARMRDKAKE